MNVPQKVRRRLAPAVLGGALVAIFLAAWVGSAGAAPRFAFNATGNVLVADQFNNRVIELSRAGNIVWHFGTGSFVAGPHTVVAPNDAQRVPGGRTLIAGTGAPAGAPGYPAGGAIDSRVLLVNQAGKIVWQYGKAGVNGTGFNRLNTPVQATWLPNHDVLITDQGNDRVIMVTPAHKIVWQYGQTGVAGSGADQLNTPNSAELLANGHVLIADEGGNRVIEVTKAKNDRLERHDGAQCTRLREPAAQRPHPDHRRRQQPRDRGQPRRHGGLVLHDQHAAGQQRQPGPFAGGPPAQRRHPDRRPVQRPRHPGHQGQEHPLELRHAQRARQGGRPAERTVLGQGHRRLHRADPAQVR